MYVKLNRSKVNLNRLVIALHWFISWLTAAWTLVVLRILLEIVSCGGLWCPAVIGRTPCWAAVQFGQAADDWPSLVTLLSRQLHIDRAVHSLPDVTYSLTGETSCEKESLFIDFLAFKPSPSQPDHVVSTSGRCRLHRGYVDIRLLRRADI